MPRAQVQYTGTPWPILGLALLLRLATPLAAWWLAGGPPLVREPDSEGYLQAAAALWHERAFTRDGRPEIVRTPGYPLLLVPGVALDLPDLWAILLQACCGTLTVYVVMKVALEAAQGCGQTALAEPAFAPRAVPRAAALAAACDPLAVLYCGKLLSETCFTTALALSLWGLLRHAATRRLLPLAWAAVALAAATFVRPIAYYLPPVAALWLACLGPPPAAQAPRHGTLPAAIWESRWFRAAVFLMLAMAPCLLWQARNDRLTGYGGFSAISDVNLYYWQAAPVVAEREGLTLVEAQTRLAERARAARLPGVPHHALQAARFFWMRREALGILRREPWLYARIHAQGMLAVLSDPGTQAWLNYVRYEPPPRPAGLAGMRRFAWALKAKFWATLVHAMLWAWVLALLGLGIAGLCRMPRGRGWWLLALVFLYLLCLSGGPLGYHRFRIPLLAVWSVWAGHGLAAGTKR
jgi:hypothetical protein